MNRRYVNGEGPKTLGLATEDSFDSVPTDIKIYITRAAAIENDLLTRHKRIESPSSTIVDS